MSGVEVTPLNAITGDYEHVRAPATWLPPPPPASHPTAQHISGDIAFAAQQYSRVSRNATWLRDAAWRMMKKICAFWAMRVTLDPASGAPSVGGIGRRLRLRRAADARGGVGWQATTPRYGPSRRTSQQAQSTAACTPT